MGIPVELKEIPTTMVPSGDSGIGDYCDIDENLLAMTP
jgi:hypothetical protein